MHDFMLMHEILILIFYFAPLFKPTIFMESLNSLIELWIFVLGKTFTNLNAWHKIINTINSNILMPMCRNGWMNKHTVKKCYTSNRQWSCPKYWG